MYYVYKKAKSVALPRFDYNLKKFEDFYELAKVLTRKITGIYCIRIKSDSYKDIIKFINNSENYRHLLVYIEMSDTLLKYVLLQKPGANVIDSKANFDVFKELVSKYNILFDKYSMSKMYWAIGHSYEEMDEALMLLKQQCPDRKEVTESDLTKLFVIDTLVYPRSVLIQYIRLDRGRKRALEKCLSYFGNDIALFSMRKTALSFLEEKTKYLKSGEGSGLIKSLPMKNIVRMCNSLAFGRSNFMDITTILNLYERGETINDYLQNESTTSSSEEYYGLR